MNEIYKLKKCERINISHKQHKKYFATQSELTTILRFSHTSFQFTYHPSLIHATMKF